MMVMELLSLLILLLLLNADPINIFKVRENEEDEESGQQETVTEPLSFTASLSEVRTRPKIINIYQV